MTTDKDAINELVLYTTNDVKLYDRIIIPTLKSFARKMKRGTYDASLALIQWQRVAEEGAKAYEKDYMMPGEWYTVFTPDVRKAAAIELQAYYAEQLEDMS